MPSREWIEFLLARQKVIEMKQSQKQSTLFFAAFIVASVCAFFGHSAAFAGSDLANGRISGVVWRDSNNNGIREPQELPLAGYPVYLQRVGEEVVGAMVAVVYSDENGAFVFENVEEGTYQVFPDEGDYVLTEVVGVNASATIELPVSVQRHQLYLPIATR